jgi:hypothetical protein
MPRRGTLAAAALSIVALTACFGPGISPGPPSLSEGEDPGRVYPGEPAPPAHRWVAGDIFEYRAEIQVWNGMQFEPLSPPVVVGIPQKGRRPSWAVAFQNLKAGRKYGVRVLAMGNVGGTAPDWVLNALNPTLLELDFTRSQDIDDSLLGKVAATLDPMPFSGNLIVEPVNTPASATGMSATLYDAESGTRRSEGVSPAGRPIKFSNLRVGVRYRVEVEARTRAGEILGRARTPEIAFDPKAQDLLPNRRVLARF